MILPIIEDSNLNYTVQYNTFRNYRMVFLPEPLFFYSFIDLVYVWRRLTKRSANRYVTSNKQIEAQHQEDTNNNTIVITKEKIPGVRYD